MNPDSCLQPYRFNLCLQDNKVLTSLNVANNNLGPEAGAALAKMLTVQSCVRCILTMLWLLVAPVRCFVNPCSQYSR
jgi:hypothetical protein